MRRLEQSPAVNRESRVSEGPLGGDVLVLSHQKWPSTLLASQKPLFTVASKRKLGIQSKRGICIHSQTEVSLFLAGVLRMASRLTLPSSPHLKVRVTLAAGHWASWQMAAMVRSLQDLTLTLCMFMRFPQWSRYCFRSLSWNTQTGSVLSSAWLGAQAQAETKPWLWTLGPLPHENLTGKQAWVLPLPHPSHSLTPSLLHPTSSTHRGRGCQPQSSSPGTQTPG